MSFILQAPYPALAATTQLPNPELSDGEGLTDEVSPFHALDGTLRTYVKTKGGRRRLFWDFLLARPKALELRAFLRVYFASQIKITDHHDRVWVGYFASNPFELTTDRGSQTNIDSVRAERASIRLEFEGVEQ